MYTTPLFNPFKPSKSWCVPYTEHLIHGFEWEVFQISPSGNLGASCTLVRPVHEQIRYLVDASTKLVFYLYKEIGRNFILILFMTVVYLKQFDIVTYEFFVDIYVQIYTSDVG